MGCSWAKECFKMHDFHRILILYYTQHTIFEYCLAHNPAENPKQTIEQKTTHNVSTLPQDVVKILNNILICKAKI